MYVQMTSPDVADSLGLSVGRYEYVKRWQEVSVNCSVAETSPAANTASDSSCSLPFETETANKLLPGGGREDRDGIDAMLGDASNTSCREKVDSDSDKLMPAVGIGDHEEGDDSGSCSAVDTQVNIIMNERAAAPINADKPAVNVESHRMEHPGSSRYADTNLNDSTVDDSSPNEGCLMKTADALVADATCTDTDR